MGEMSIFEQIDGIIIDFSHSRKHNPAGTAGNFKADPLEFAPRR